ncbi:hypothetical protein GHK63_25285 [Sinorhizobium meliloti]|nr:hypothetical protein [Sinorhizobium meliloti]
MACALGHKACNDDRSVLYLSSLSRVPSEVAPKRPDMLRFEIAS